MVIVITLLPALLLIFDGVIIEPRWECAALQKKNRVQG